MPHSAPSIRYGTTLAICATALCASIPSFAADHSREDAGKPWSLATGFGVASSPSYLGSDHTKTRVLPFIEASYQTSLGKLSLGGGEGGPRLRWSHDLSEATEFGLQVGQSGGRKASDDRNLNGLGDLKNTAEFGVFASQRIDRFAIRVAANKGSSSGHGGTLVNLEGEYTHPVSNSLSLNGGIGLTWASNTYMQRYFGISNEQAASSGLARHTATSGVRDLAVSVGVNWRPAKNWMLLAQASALRLQGDAKDSPIVKRATQTQFMTGFVYLW